MNNKGFTLIELIAMVVILGILMLITVPNMAGIIKNNKEIAAGEDINRMVNNAKTKFNIKEVRYPKMEGYCVVLSLDYLDSNEDLKSGINGGKYSRTKSFLVVRKDKADDDSYKYTYYVRIVEESDGQEFEIPIVDVDEFQKEPKKYLTNLQPTVDIDVSNVTTESIVPLLRQAGLECTKIDNIVVN